eukprot:271247-Chlamydomonas_euryale.AAC.1
MRLGGGVGKVRGLVGNVCGGWRDKCVGSAWGKGGLRGQVCVVLRGPADEEGCAVGGGEELARCGRGGEKRCGEVEKMRGQENSDTPDTRNTHTDARKQSRAQSRTHARARARTYARTRAPAYTHNCSNNCLSRRVQF